MSNVVLHGLDCGMYMYLAHGLAVDRVNSTIGSPEPTVTVLFHGSIGS